MYNENQIELVSNIEYPTTSFVIKRCSHTLISSVIDTLNIMNSMPKESTYYEILNKVFCIQISTKCMLDKLNLTITTNDHYNNECLVNILQCNIKQLQECCFFAQTNNFTNMLNWLSEYISEFETVEYLLTVKD
jgi:hypothetical protein